MGSIGSSTSSSGSSVQFEVTSPSRGQRIEGKDIIDEAKDSLRRILEDYQDVDRIYEALADYYPRSMYDSDSEKLIKVDLKTGTADFIDFDIRDDITPGKITVSLAPERFDLDEFSDSELSRLGIKRTGKKYNWE